MQRPSESRNCNYWGNHHNTITSIQKHWWLSSDDCQSNISDTRLLPPALTMHECHHYRERSFCNGTKQRQLTSSMEALECSFIADARFLLPANNDFLAPFSSTTSVVYPPSNSHMSAIIVLSAILLLVYSRSSLTPFHSFSSNSNGVLSE
jgi:hypothetical protein